jgi:hypothetical protein
MELMVKPHYLDTSETVNSYSEDFLISRPISNKEHANKFFFIKVQRAALTCDVIKKVAPFVLSKL